MSDIRKVWYLHKFRKQAWLNKKMLLEIQEKKLRMLINHAYENVEFYHRRFDSVGLKPGDIKQVKDLRKLPITSKEDIQKNYPMKIVARNMDLNKCTKYSTSGSTGTPVEVVVDPKGSDHRAAVFGRPFFECGLGLRDRMMLVGDPKRFQRGTHWYQKVGFLKRRYFPATEPVELQLPEIVKYKPDSIFAYSSYLFLLARAVKKLDIGVLSPKLIFATADVLEEKQRQFIESVLGGEVFDLYGCVETERLAWECEKHSGYHMDIDNDVIEFTKDGEVVSAGEKGEITVTCLFNYAMPLIRYQLGDIAVQLDDECSCGRGLPLMGRILGRQDDFVVRPDGRLIISPIFVYIMREIPGVAQFRIVQESIGKIAVSIVKSDRFSNETLEKVVDGIGRVVGRDVSVNVSVVNEIERERSGKIRAVVSQASNS